MTWIGMSASGSEPNGHRKFLLFSDWSFAVGTKSEEFSRRPDRAMPGEVEVL
jgi:hypothetical protein